VRIDTKSGHGAGTATTKRLEQMADLYTFILKSLDIQLEEQ
jgi:prolyl oligopeptidase